MKVIQDLKYTSSHEWIRLAGNTAFIGISDYAQSHLGTIVFLELPEPDDQVSKGASLAVVESVKAASDIYAPLSGTITQINEELIDDPEQINKEPYESWFASIDLSYPAELAELMDADEYEKFCQREE